MEQTVKPIIETSFYWAKREGGHLNLIDANSFDSKQQAYKQLEIYFSRGSFLWDDLVLIESSCCKNPLEIEETIES